MTQSSRTTNSIKNVIANILYQVFIIFMNFITRWIFVKIFDPSYLGINGLFSNILSILSLAELGISGAMLYSLYKPMYEGDKKQISALISYYKILYNRIACIVAIIGLCFFPFLKYVINMDGNIPYLEIYYLLYLLGVVSSYLFVYKSSVISAAQKDYKLKIYNMAFTIIKFILQILSLIIFKSFMVYTIIQIIVSIANNYFISYKAEQWYPYIKDKNYLDNASKKNVWNRIKSLFLYQIGGVALNNTDNILISTLVGTVTLGIYSNYTMIISNLSNALSLFFLGVHSSLGNLNASNNNEKKVFVFKLLNIIGFWLYVFSSICLLILTQDFITIFFGKVYMIDNFTLIVAVLNFYFSGSFYPLACYRTTIGLFNETKYIMLFTAIINLVLSIVLGIYFGLVGILSATFIARLLTTFWYEPRKLYKIFFKQSPLSYYLSHVLNFLYILIMTIVLKIVLDSIDINNIYITFTIKLSVCMIFINFMYFIIFKNTEEFKYLLKLLKEKIIQRNGE